MQTRQVYYVDAAGVRARLDLARERRLGGVQKVRYYASALDPELSNLRVATVGLAVRPWRAGSLEVLRYEYRPDVSIAGIQRLGTAWDVVLGLKASKAFRLAATIGSFTSDAPAIYSNERVVEIKFGYVF